MSKGQARRAYLARLGSLCRRGLDPRPVPGKVIDIARGRGGAGGVPGIAWPSRPSQTRVSAIAGDFDCESVYEYDEGEATFRPTLFSPAIAY